MKTSKVNPRIGDLVRLLGGMTDLNEQLAVVLDEKIESMRRADVEAMGGCEQREGKLVDSLRERDGLRKQMMDGIGVELGLPAKAGRSLTLTQLGLRVNDAERATLASAGDRLKSAVTKVRQVERVAAAVSREVLHHLQWVFAAVKPKDDGANVYANDGALVRGGGSTMVELVG